MLHTESGGHVELPRVQACQTHGVWRHAVIAVAQRENLKLARVQASHVHGEIVGLRTAVGEHAHLQIAGHFVHKFARVRVNARIHVDGCGVPQLVNLALQRRVHFGMTVADADGHDAGEQVQVALVVRVPDPLHVRLVDHEVVLVVGEDALAQMGLASVQHLFERGALCRYK